VCWQWYLAQDIAKGGKRGKRIEPANQARIPSASDPSVSRGNDCQEEEQAARCLYGNDGIQSQVRDVAPQPCESAAIHTSAHPSRHYGPEVQHALFLVWNASNRIWPNVSCPFSPRLSKRLPRHEHLHLTEESRRQLLSMSAATADRRLAFPAQTRSARRLHHASGNPAHAADSHPHLPTVEGDPGKARSLSWVSAASSIAGEALG
jgi:hypothetical protein